MKILIPKEIHEFFLRHRVTVIVPLYEIAAILSQERDLFVFFNALGDGLFTEFLGHSYDCPADIIGSGSFAYAIDKLQDRGRFFISPQENVYEGQVIGENNRADDLVVNVTKSKKLSNVRAAGSDDKVRLAPPIRFSLEEALEYIREDEYVEETPQSIRLRKIFLKEHERKRASREA